MKSVIITGGISTGKSTVSDLFRGAFGPGECLFFDADREVHDQLTKAEVVRLITEAFGSSVIDTGGQVARKRLRDIIFGDAESRGRLEAILHPRVLERCIEGQTNAHRSGAAVFLADIPLYFEAKSFDVPDVDVVVVATDRLTQIRRLRKRSNVTEEMARMMIESQMPLELKMQRADYAVWNAGDTAVLADQVGILTTALKEDA